MKKLIAFLLLAVFTLSLLASCVPIDIDEERYLYNDFTPQERSLLREHLGTVIPFLPNDEYYVKGLYDKNDYKYGVRFITYGNTEEEYEEYLAEIEKIATPGNPVTEDGREWNTFKGEDLTFNISFYTESGESVICVAVTSLSLSADPNPNPDPDPEPTEVGYYVACNNASKTLYLTSSITGGRFDGTTDKSQAALVYVEAAGNVGYYLYIYVGTVKNYIVLDDSSSGASLTTSVGNAGIFVWEATLKTMKSADSTNNRGLGMKPDSTYDNFSSYDTSNTSYNWSSYKTEGGVEFSPNGISGGAQNPGGDTTGGGSTQHLYSDFTSGEKSLLTQYLGAVIPFVANSEYYLTDRNGNTTNYEYGFNFYTWGNTKAEFDAYRSLIQSSGYEFDSTYEDDYGETCYVYYNGDIVIDVCYYESDGDFVIDVYAYSEEHSVELPEDSEGGNTNAEVIKNDGKGLPEDTNGTGLVKVDFTAADKVKDVTDQGYYIDGCPTVGSPGVLVVPLEFPDVTAQNKNYTIDKIIDAFTGAVGTTDYYSVDEYYKISSAGKLDLDITVLDEWFKAANNSSYYKNYTMEYDGSTVEAGDQLLIDEILKYLEPKMDLSQFDSDGNGTIDAIVIINTLDIDSESVFNWAYRYWNIYTDDQGYYYEYDGVSANDFLWASYGFMHESYDQDGNASYDDTTALSTYTYIHEFGHVLGADDYYDTSYSADTTPMDGADIMDSMQGDHNAFTKFNYGWLTESQLVVTDSSVEVTLSDFYTSGDTLIIANNWDMTLGAYQEYFIVVFYTNNGLNSDGNGYFTCDGIIVYHVNASLYSEEYDGEIYYDIYNNNTDPSDEYGTENNLIEYVKSGEGNFTYIEGDTLPETELDSGEALDFTFVVNSVGAESATITVSRLAA